MARRRRGRPVHGWVVIDKPSGMTSAHVVAKVKRALDAAKAGHAGTLDPLATGILPIALGEATKTVPYIVDGEKAYIFTARWGEQRTTDDTEGEVMETSDARPGADEIAAALSAFTGWIDQVPPVYSAIKVDGRRSYDLARADEAVELAPRRVLIKSFTLREVPDADHAVFEVECGKGAYIRSLARDLARRLGTRGHVVSIRRTRVGPFSEGDAISLDKLESVRHIAPPFEHLLPVETALDDIPALALTVPQADHLRHGRAVRVRGVGGRPVVDVEGVDDGQVLCAMSGGQPVAIVRLDGEDLQPVRVLNVQ